MVFVLHGTDGRPSRRHLHLPLRISDSIRYCFLVVPVISGCFQLFPEFFPVFPGEKNGPQYPSDWGAS